MTLAYARQKECWNCQRPYDAVYWNPTAPNQIVGECNECGSIHSLGYKNKEKEGEKDE